MPGSKQRTCWVVYAAHHPHEAGAIAATLTVHLCRLWHTGEECVAQGLLAPQRGPQCSGPRSTTSRLLTGLQDAFLLFPVLE